MAPQTSECDDQSAPCATGLEASVGTEQVREVTHEGGLMVLRPPVRTYVGRPPEQRVLYWERISDVDG